MLETRKQRCHKTHNKHLDLFEKTPPIALRKRCPAISIHFRYQGWICNSTCTSTCLACSSSDCNESREVYTTSQTSPAFCISLLSTSSTHSFLPHLKQICHHFRSGKIKEIKPSKKVTVGSRADNIRTYTTYQKCKRLTNPMSAEAILPAGSASAARSPATPSLGCSAR